MVMKVDDGCWLTVLLARADGVVELSGARYSCWQGLTVQRADSAPLFFFLLLLLPFFLLLFFLGWGCLNESRDFFFFFPLGLGQTKRL